MFVTSPPGTTPRATAGAQQNGLRRGDDLELGHTEHAASEAEQLSSTVMTYQHKHPT